MQCFTVDYYLSVQVAWADSHSSMTLACQYSSITNIHITYTRNPLCYKMWCWLIDWVRLNVPPTQYRSYEDGFLRVKWPNQQCQSTEGTHKTKQNRTKHHNLQGGSKWNTPPDNMQYLRNQWSDFKNSWSSLILTLLWIYDIQVYPVHLNYTTTLPCKAITTKITIFIIVLV